MRQNWQPAEQKQDRRDKERAVQSHPQGVGFDFRSANRQEKEGSKSVPLLQIVTDRETAPRRDESKPNFESHISAASMIRPPLF